MNIRFSLLAFFMLSCSPNSKEEWRLEGGNIAKSLISDLREVESVEDLKQIEPRIKKKFQKLVDLMIAAKKYHIKHSDEEDAKEKPIGVSNLLKKELVRIYQIDGCDSYLEEIERDSLHRLDQFAKRLQKAES